MNNFSSAVKNKVFEAIEKYNMLNKTETVLVGFSGGADSVCLLHFLNFYKDEFGVELNAVHVNHGLRGEEAERDEAFCIEFCKKHNIPLFVKKFNCIELAAESKESLEECGRRIRYTYFNELCGRNGKIATAHNANDNAETVIFNLSRGTSLKGVTGIPAVRDNIIRPLIFCSREEIEGYCKENGLLFVTDSTNLSDKYTRNKIRHNVLPVMQEVNSSAISNVSSFCENVQDIYSYINLQSCKVLDESRLGENTYNVDVLQGLHIALLRECIVVSYNIFSGKTLDGNKVNGIVNLINSKGRLQLYGDEFVEVIKNKLRFFKANTNSVPSEVKVTDLAEIVFGEFKISFSEFTESLKNKNKKLLANLIDCDKIVGNLYLRTRREGDKITLPNRNGSKSLKKLFNEMAVPVELRDYVPVLCDDTGVIWVYGVGVCLRCFPTETSSNIIALKGENNG